ncbi:imidazole glycerol phosphate synthase subunit HisH [Thermodesulfobacteriota bacterium]
MIVIIDYGAGNLCSVLNAFEAIGQKTCLTNDPKKIAKASAIVLPGVGAFGDCMANLHRLHLVELLNELVLSEKKPYLGICLGLQFLAERSYEQGEHKGLGWIKGEVRRIESKNKNFRIPHMGWNNIEYKNNCPLFYDMTREPVFYFVHSYQFCVKDENYITATCFHGTTIVASIQKNNIFGVQFHPEKSQENGIKLLKNFINII